jgi:hypothetical protein
MRLPFIGEMPNGGAKHYGGEPWRGVIHPGNGNRPTIQHKGKNYRVSRLVCEAFHGGPPFDGAVVMHLDDDQTNNCANNLKWGSQKENLNAPRFLAYCRTRTGAASPVYKARLKRASQ